MKKRILLGLATATTLAMFAPTTAEAMEWFNQPNVPTKAEEGDSWIRNVGDGEDTFYYENGKWQLTFTSSKRRIEAMDKYKEKVEQAYRNAAKNPDYYSYLPENERVNVFLVTDYFYGVVSIPKEFNKDVGLAYYDENTPEMLSIIGNPYGNDNNIGEKDNNSKPTEPIIDVPKDGNIVPPIIDIPKDGNTNTPITQSVAMYRLYNPNSGEHFYTSNNAEKRHLVKIGWKDEGIGWTAPKTGDPVYRLYNPNNGDHHYTMKLAEKNNLVKLGWKDEGIGWYSAENGKFKIYRLYNPYARTASHHYTFNQSEINFLVEKGWKYEGLAWFGLK